MEEKYVNQDLDEFLDTPEEFRQVGTFLKKTQYAGKIITAKIVGVEKNKLAVKKVDLLIIIDGTEDILNMGLSAGDLNTMISNFGPVKREWIGKRIRVEFSPIKEWDDANGIHKIGSTTKIYKI